MPINTKLSNADYRKLIESVYLNDAPIEQRFNQIDAQLEWRKANLNNDALIADMQTLINLQFIVSFTQINELFHHVIATCHQPEKKLISVTSTSTTGRFMSKNTSNVSRNYDVRTIPFALIVEAEFKDMALRLPNPIMKWINNEIKNTTYINKGEPKNIFDMLKSQLNRHAPLMNSFTYLMVEDQSDRFRPDKPPLTTEQMNTTKRLLEIRQTILDDQVSETEKQLQVAEIDYLLILRSAQKQIYHKLIRWYRINLVKESNPNYKFIVDLLNQCVLSPLNHIKIQ